MSAPRPAPTAAGGTGVRFPSLRRAALVAVVVNLAIVATGGIVRVTGSGLGCPDWPSCSGDSVLPPASEAQWHTWIEFGNRLMSFVVLAAAVWVVLAARREARHRADITRLAWAQPAGVLAQAVLGGITVLTGLHPLVVASHFLASMALVAAAVVLFDRAGGLQAEPVRGMRVATAGIVVAAGSVLVLGTMVTASGPHAGDPGTPRLGLDIRTMAVAHADAVWVLVGLTVAVLAVAVGHRARRTTRAAAVLLGLEVAQGALGYAQYALGVPRIPVIVHILGAGVVWAAAWQVAMAVRDAPGDAGEPVVEQAEVLDVAST